MNVHKNARLTPRGREVLVSRLERGEHPRDMGTAMGVSASTVYKWRRRYRAEGRAGRDLDRLVAAPPLQRLALGRNRQITGCPENGRAFIRLYEPNEIQRHLVHLGIGDQVQGFGDRIGSVRQILQSRPYAVDRDRGERPFFGEYDR